MADEQPVGRDDDATDHGNHDALDVDAGHIGDSKDRAGKNAADDRTDDAQMITAMTPSEPPMIMVVMKPAVAPRTIHAMMPIMAAPPLEYGLGTTRRASTALLPGAGECGVTRNGSFSSARSGGLGGWQAEPFILCPPTLHMTEDPPVGAPAVYRQLKAWQAQLQGTHGG